MKLSQIIRSAEIVTRKGPAEDPEIPALAYNSRQVAAGGLFVAIVGFKTDGHRYIGDAIARGAAVIVHQEPLAEYDPRVIYLLVTNPRRLLGTMAARFYHDPSARLTVTGVTGTNGKTSTTSMLKHVLETADHTVGMMGTINNQIGHQILDNAGRTTPESLDTQEIIHEMVGAGCDELVMEASSHALDLDRVNGVHFAYGVFTNLTQDHLDYHKTLDNYFAAKAKLFDLTEKAAIINGDDPWGQKLISRLTDEGRLSVITYGLGAECDYRAADIDYQISGTGFTVVTPRGSYPVFLDLPGEFMVYNALAVIACAEAQGISSEIIQTALKSMPTVEGRMEVLDLGTEFDIIIDYAHSPDSLEKLLESARLLYDGKIYLVFGCNGDRDKEKRPIMGRIAGRGADYVIVTSDNPASEDPQSIIDAVVAGVAAETDRYETVLRRWDAIYHAVTLPGPGDVLLLAGKGHEKQETMATENLYYNEWETAEEAVRRLQGGA